jgi:hypothetical protein
MRRFGVRSSARAAVTTAILALLVSTGCGGRSYEPADLSAVDFLSRAQSGESGDIRVKAAVPSPDETIKLFGLDLYAHGIQPVWIQVDNRSEQAMRFAPVSVDRDYYAPLEVAYAHRGGFSKAGRNALDRHFHDTAMPRPIPPNSTRSGFVYTHARPGTKGFNVDLFGDVGSHHGFTFFIDVPGFVADHSAVDFDDLYAPGEVEDHDETSLRRALSELACCTTDATGEKRGIPLGLVLVAEGEDLLHALLRAGWVETPLEERQSAGGGAHYWRGRTADATFRMQRQNARERNVLRLWLAPYRVEEKQVWVGQITHYLGRGRKLAEALLGDRLDPDIDDARNYMLQVMWYSQGLVAYSWSASGQRAAISEPATDFSGARWFSDGRRIVLWLSGPTVSLLDARNVAWDGPYLGGREALR